MPLYEFQCDACENRWERIQKYTDPNPEVCPKCGKGPVRKLPSSPAIQFKGSGFYITDYPKKSSSEASAAKPSGPSESSASTSSTSSSGESKSESKSDSKSESKSSDTKSTGSKSSDSKS
jgi:putative FmdB family regulatory protein